MSEFPERALDAVHDDVVEQRLALHYAPNGVDLVVADVVTDFGELRSMLVTTAPSEWERVAAYLYGLLDREPMKSADGYAAHRILLGAIAAALRQYARLAGDPVGLEVDLRNAKTKAGRRAVQARIDANRELLHLWMEQRVHVDLGEGAEVGSDA